MGKKKKTTKKKTTKKKTTTSLLDEKIAALQEVENPKEISDTMVLNALDSLSSEVEEELARTTAIEIIQETTPEEDLEEKLNLDNQEVQVEIEEEQPESQPESTPYPVEEQESDNHFQEKMEEWLNQNEQVTDEFSQSVDHPEAVKEVYSLQNKKERSYNTRLLENVTVIIILASIALATWLLGYKSITYTSIKIDETATVHYGVCLKENEYYKKDCLEEGQAYLSLLTDKITADFNYTKITSEPVEVNTTYKIIAHVAIKKDDASVLYEENYTLVPETQYKGSKNVSNIDKTIDIPYKEYNELVNSYLTKYGITSNAEVEVSMYIGGKVVSSLTIPLSSQTYRITKQENANESFKRTMDKEQSLATKAYLTIGTITSLAALTIAVLTARKFKRYTKEESKYEKELSRILKEYDRFIVESTKVDITKNIGTKEIYKVKSFNELLDARDAVEKPIIYVRINAIKSGFYIVDQNVCYEYIMKEVDM